jgi:hypothetical protein
VAARVADVLEQLLVLIGDPVPRVALGALARSFAGSLDLVRVV